MILFIKEKLCPHNNTIILEETKVHGIISMFSSTLQMAVHQAHETLKGSNNKQLRKMTKRLQNHNWILTRIRYIATNI